MNSVITKLELWGAILKNAGGDIEASVLFIRLDGECHSIIVESITDDRDSDYDFYLKLLNCNEVSDFDNLVKIASMENVKVDFISKLADQIESKNMYSSIRCESLTEILTVKPSARFYFSKVVRSERK